MSERKVILAATLAVAIAAVPAALAQTPDTPRRPDQPSSSTQSSSGDNLERGQQQLEGVVVSWDRDKRVLTLRDASNQVHTIHYAAGDAASQSFSAGQHARVVVETLAGGRVIAVSPRASVSVQQSDADRTGSATPGGMTGSGSTSAGMSGSAGSASASGEAVLSCAGAGDVLTVRDRSGHSYRIKLDQNTLIQGMLDSGQRVEVRFNSESGSTGNLFAIVNTNTGGAWRSGSAGEDQRSPGWNRSSSSSGSSSSGSWSSSGSSGSPSGGAPNEGNSLTGTIVSWDPGSRILRLRDETNREVTIYWDEQTQIDGTPAVGDRVQVSVNRANAGRTTATRIQRTSGQGSPTTGSPSSGPSNRDDIDSPGRDDEPERGEHGGPGSERPDEHSSPDRPR